MRSWRMETSTKRCAPDQSYAGRARVPPPPAIRSVRFAELHVIAVEDPDPQNLRLSMQRVGGIDRATARQLLGDVVAEGLCRMIEPADLDHVVGSRRAEPDDDRDQEGQAQEPPAQPAAERAFGMINHSFDYRRSASLR